MDFELPPLLQTFNRDTFFLLVNEMRPLNQGRLIALTAYTRQHVQANRCSALEAEDWLKEAQIIYKREQRHIFCKSTFLGIVTCIILYKLINYSMN